MEPGRWPAARADGVRCTVWMDVVRHQREGICVPPAGAGASSYRRHRPEDTVRYGVVEQHANAFFEGQGERGSALPRFVRAEFEATLRCGRLEHG